MHPFKQQLSLECDSSYIDVFFSFLLQSTVSTGMAASDAKDKPPVINSDIHHNIIHCSIQSIVSAGMEDSDAQDKPPVINSDIHHNIIHCNIQSTVCTGISF